MAIKKIVEIGANVKEAVGEIKDLFNELLEAERQAERLKEELNEAGDSGGKSMKKVEDGTKGTSSAMRTLGTTIKATGIGLLVSLLGSLTMVLTENQTVIDTTKKYFTAFTMAVNDAISFITNSIPKVKDFFNQFGENPKKKLKEMGNAIRDYLLRYVQKSVEAVKLLGDALKEFFSGNFGKSWDKLSESVSLYFDAVTGVDDAYNKLKDTVGEYLDEAEDIVKLSNNARLAEAQLQITIAKYNRLAEQQRQIRDDERLSIEERIKANEQLDKILEEQQKAQLRLADASIASANADLRVNDNLENKVALLNAIANKESILEQIEGQRSEQLNNRWQLEFELFELKQLQQEQDAKTALFNEKVNKQYETDAIKRLENELQLLEQELELEERRLEEKTLMYKEGTLRRQEAENELVAFREEKELEIAEKEREILKSKEERDREVLQRIMDNENLNYSERYNALDEYLTAVVDATQLSEYEQNKLIEDATKKRIELAEKEKQAKLDMFGAISQAGDAMAQAVGEQTALGKSLAVASALISTYQGIANEIGTKTVTPYEIALKIANIATVAAVGFKSVKDILSVKVPYGGSSGGGASGGTPQAPNFNIVGQSSTNQLAETIGQQEQEPVQAYVVATEMTTQQALQRNIRETASFG